jgi:hypothetical protein
MTGGPVLVRGGMRAGLHAHHTIVPCQLATMRG